MTEDQVKALTHRVALVNETVARISDMSTAMIVSDRPPSTEDVARLVGAVCTIVGVLTVSISEIASCVGRIADQGDADIQAHIANAVNQGVEARANELIEERTKRDFIGMRKQST